MNFFVILKKSFNNKILVLRFKYKLTFKIKKTTKK